MNKSNNLSNCNQSSESLNKNVFDDDDVINLCMSGGTSASKHTSAFSNINFDNNDKYSTLSSETMFGSSENGFGSCASEFGCINDENGNNLFENQNGFSASACCDTCEANGIKCKFDKKNLKRKQNEMNKFDNCEDFTCVEPPKKRMRLSSTSMTKNEVKSDANKLKNDEMRSENSKNNKFEINNKRLKREIDDDDDESEEEMDLNNDEIQLSRALVNVVPVRGVTKNNNSNSSNSPNCTDNVQNQLSLESNSGLLGKFIEMTYDDLSSTGSADIPNEFNSETIAKAQLLAKELHDYARRKTSNNKNDNNNAAQKFELPPVMAVVIDNSTSLSFSVCLFLFCVFVRVLVRI